MIEFLFVKLNGLRVKSFRENSKELGREASKAFFKTTCYFGSIHRFDFFEKAGQKAVVDLINEEHLQLASLLACVLFDFLKNLLPAVASPEREGASQERR